MFLLIAVFFALSIATIYFFVRDEINTLIDEDEEMMNDERNDESYFGGKQDEYCFEAID